MGRDSGPWRGDGRTWNHGWPLQIFQRHFESGRISSVVTGKVGTNRFITPIRISRWPIESLDRASLSHNGRYSVKAGIFNLSFMAVIVVGVAFARRTRLFRLDLSSLFVIVSWLAIHYAGSCDAIEPRVMYNWESALALPALIIATVGFLQWIGEFPNPKTALMIAVQIGTGFGIFLLILHFSLTPLSHPHDLKLFLCLVAIESTGLTGLVFLAYVTQHS